MTRYTLHVPLFYNNGTRVPLAEANLVENQILALAGGFTAVEALGAWRSDDTGRTYRELVTLYHVDTDDDIAPELERIAENVARRLKQEAVYVTAQDITASLVTPRQDVPA